MKNNFKNAAFLLIALQILAACNTDIKKENNKKVEKTSEVVFEHNHVMTKAEQDSLTPDQVLEDFKNGNQPAKATKTESAATPSASAPASTESKPAAA